MAERPDLYEIERCLKAEGVSYVSQGWAPIGYQRTVDLLRYCRELEAENQRLQAFYEAHRYMEEKDLGPKI